MATASTRVLTLFDPDDEHIWCDTRFDQQLFARIVDPQRCHDHIRAHIMHPELDVHLFFSDTQVELIKNWSPEYNDAVKYIYCSDQTAINTIREAYGRRFAHKLFTADDLEFEIHHVHIALLRSLAKQAPPESNERDRIISISLGEIDILSHNLTQMMTDQPSEQPIERH